MTSGTSSDNEWYNEWQQMTTHGATTDNEWYNEWKPMRTSDNKWQWVTVNDIDAERSAAGLFKYVWHFCYHQALKG